MLGNRRFFRGGRIAAVAAVLMLAGCNAGYIAQSVRGEMTILSHRQDIDTLVAATDTPPELKDRLQLATEIRRFAADELALPDNGSYHTYVDLGRNYVLWNVVATPPLSLQPQTWCFPIAGCVSYRGYFKEADARAFGDELRRQGYDVTVGGTTAFSTLGWLNDPILNTILFSPDFLLAGTIFHELAHQRVYVENDTTFNESYAMTVEAAGVQRWLAAHGTPAMAAAYAAYNHREDGFLNLVLDARQQLDDLYRSDASDADKLTGKQRVFAQLLRRYAGLKASWGGYSGYDGFFATDLNNAKLASVVTYNADVPAFENLLAQQHGDMAAFHDAVEALAHLAPADRAAALAQLAR